MESRQNKVSQDTEKLKEIPKWARRYAESRTALLIVYSMIFIVFFGAVALGVYCLLKGWFILATIMMILYIAGFLYFVITSDRHEDRYFVKTGIPQSESVQKIRKFLPLSILHASVAVWPLAFALPDILRHPCSLGLGGSAALFRRDFWCPVKYITCAHIQSSGFHHRPPL